MENPDQSSLLEPLSERELEVLRLVADGMSNREIAQELVIALETVKWYNKQIYGKLGASNRTQAAALARELGLLDGEGEAAAPALAARPRVQTVPAQVTSFVGRRHELAEIKELLRDARLITLTGSGGTGKTRLALEVARQVEQDYSDGVCFVGLGSIRDPALVAEAVAQALGITQVGAGSLEATLKLILSHKQALLVLDNFEHLMEATSLISDLLAAAPDVSILATSREVLHIYGEQEYPVSPLGLPDTGNSLSLATASQIDAIALFEDRAQAARPDFALTEDNLPSVTEICVHLDGLPLAIELAAARVKLFTPEALVERLEDRLGALTGGSRDLPTRQRALRSTIDWSYDLLDGDEKALFSHLAVFRGGWTLHAAEVICAEGLPIDVVDGVTSLLDKSLILQEEGPDGEPRFRLLNTVRSYARERVEHTGAHVELRRRHAAYYLALAEEADPELRLHNQSIWFNRLQAEHDNLRSALNWAYEAGEPAFGVQLAGALGYFWYFQGHYADGQRWLTLAVEHLDTAAPEVQARTLRMASLMAFAHHEMDRSTALQKASLDLYRELGDQPEIGLSMALLAGQWMGRPEEYEDAIAMCEEGLELLREYDDKPGLASGLNILGELTRLKGDYERAKEAYEACITVSRQIGDKRRECMNLHNLAFLAQHEGDYPAAEALLYASLNLARKIDFHPNVASCLVVLAGTAAFQGEPERGARLAGAAEGIFEAIGTMPQPGDQPEYDRYMEAIREQLDEAAFEAAWQEGRAMSREEAVAYGLRTLVPIPKVPEK